MTKIIWILTMVGLLALACESTSSSQDEDDDGNGGGDTDTDSDGDSDTGTEPSPDDTDPVDSDTTCAEAPFDIELLPSNLLLLVDLSNSMGQPVSGDTDDTTSPSKWSQAQPAMGQLIETYKNLIAFCVDVFPDAQEPETTGDNNCTVHNPMKVPCPVDTNGNGIADENGAASSYIWGSGPLGGSTPLYCGMNVLDNTASGGYAPSFIESQAPKYLVVLSDGADLCGEGCAVCFPSGFPPTVPESCRSTPDEFATLTEELHALHGIKTFAIGFGKEVSDSNVAKGQLNAIAANGHTGFDEYFDVTDETSLNDVFSTIAAAAVSCTFEITDLPPDADRTKVNWYFDQDGVETVIPYDEGCADGSGWDWTDETKTAITFCAEACALLQTGTVDEVIGRFGCQTIVV